jgi:hypothetical protein
MPMLAQQYHASSTTRTSVNRNTNVNVNKNANVNVNRNTNVNVNRNTNVNVSVNHSGAYYGGSSCCYRGPSTAAIVATTAVVTAAVIGARVYALPPACTVVHVNGLTYQQCGSTWYQPQFVGSSPSYIVVVAPR